MGVSAISRFKFLNPVVSVSIILGLYVHVVTIG